MKIQNARGIENKERKEAFSKVPQSIEKSS